MDIEDALDQPINIDKPFLSTKIQHAPPPVPKPAAPALPSNIFSTATSLKLAALLSEYDKQVVESANQLRTYITNKLLEISGSGNARDELRALEMLGKISDVGLFVEKSEVKITHTASVELENSIRNKIERILQAKLPAAPVDDEIDGDYTEVSPEDYELDPDAPDYDDDEPDEDAPDDEEED